MRWAWVFSSSAPLFCLACSAAPLPATEQTNHAAAPAPAAIDPCRVEPGAPPPAPLTRQYEGLLASARCRAEVDVIMKGVATALGVRCNYCHLEHDFAADTQQKRVANFMATELVPRLRAKQGGAVTCASCHLEAGRGVAKILGSPRSESRALEWMTSVLTERFESVDDQPLRCKSCHGANWGSPEFQRKLLLSDALAKLPRKPTTP